MNTTFRFPDFAWLVNQIELKEFLDIAFANMYGEIWLYNSDLHALIDRDMFEALYMRGVVHHMGNLHAIRILARKGALPNELRDLLQNRQFIQNMKRLEQKAGRAAREKLFFGVVDPTLIPDDSRSSTLINDTWVFYTDAGFQRGIVMHRPPGQPYIGTAQEARGDRMTLVWILQQFGVLHDRIRDVFPQCFRSAQYCGLSKSGDGYVFVDASPDAPDAVRADQVPLSLGDAADVVIYTALEQERQAVVDAVAGAAENVHKLPLSKGMSYFVMEDDMGAKRYVVLLSPNEQGPLTAVLKCSEAIQWWKPKLVLLVGVAGGRPVEMRQQLGDVLIPRNVVGYDSCKIENGSVIPRPEHFQVSEAVTSVAGQVKLDEAWRARIAKLRPKSLQGGIGVDDDCVVLSGSVLIDDDKAFTAAVERAGNLDKVRGVEMEGAGVGRACRPGSTEFGFVKGIMDKASGDRATMGQDEKELRMAYAARTASEVAIEIIRRVQLGR